jgi:hypothetical protein
MRKLLLLGIAGLALAVGVGFAANAISRDSIGLASMPAGSGIELSPAKTTGAAAGPKSAGSAAATKPKPAHRPPSGTRTTATTPAAPAAPTTRDDHGGRNRGGSGSTPGGSGSGSSGGSGSGGSGGGGSGSGGSGGGSGGGHGGDD